MHRAIFRNCAWLRLHAIGPNYIVDVCGNRGWNERPIFAALCATGLAALSAKAGTLDAPREAIHGVSAPGDTALPALRARRATRPRGRDLGELFSALREYRVLDERRIRRAERIGCDETDFHRAPARACNLQRYLFHRREVSLNERHLRQFTTPR